MRWASASDTSASSRAVVVADDDASPHVYDAVVADPTASDHAHLHPPPVFPTVPPPSSSLPSSSSSSPSLATAFSLCRRCCSCCCCVDDDATVVVVVVVVVVTVRAFTAAAGSCCSCSLRVMKMLLYCIAPKLDTHCNVQSVNLPTFRTVWKARKIIAALVHHWCVRKFRALIKAFRYRRDCAAMSQQWCHHFAFQTACQDSCRKEGRVYFTTFTVRCLMDCDAGLLWNIEVGPVHSLDGSLPQHNNIPIIKWGTTKAVRCIPSLVLITMQNDCEFQRP